MDRLQCLVFSFYREDPLLERILEPLHSSRMQRQMGVIHIDCLDAEHLKKISYLIPYIREPFALLGFGRQIILRAGDLNKLIYPIHMSSHSTFC